MLCFVASQWWVGVRRFDPRACVGWDKKEVSAPHVADIAGWMMGNEVSDEPPSLSDLAVQRSSGREWETDGGRDRRILLVSFITLTAMTYWRVEQGFSQAWSLWLGHMGDALLAKIVMMTEKGSWSLSPETHIQYFFFKCHLPSRFGFNMPYTLHRCVHEHRLGVNVKIAESYHLWQWINHLGDLNTCSIYCI